MQRQQPQVLHWLASTAGRAPMFRTVLLVLPPKTLETAL
jgi:hypothetical protein